MVKRRALVTGATGGLGRFLCAHLLENGYHVHATGRNQSIGHQLESLGCYFTQGDLRTCNMAELVAECDVVFHLAANTSPWGPHKPFFDINVLATRRLLDACTQSKCSTFVFASSPSIYTESRHRENLTEEDPVAARFINHYTQTKYQAENDVINAHGPKLRTVVLRPRAIISEFDTVLLPRLLKASKKGILPLPNKGQARIEITDVRDVVTAFHRAAELTMDNAPAVFNISGGAPREVRHIMEILFRELHVSVRICGVSTRTLMALTKAIEFMAINIGLRKEPALTQFSVVSLAYTQTFDLTKAESCLQWQPQYSPEDLSLIHI